MANRYFKGSKLSEGTFRSVVRCFSRDLTAKETAKKCGVSERTAAALFRAFRDRITSHGAPGTPLFDHVQIAIKPLREPGPRGASNKGTSNKTRALVLIQVGGKVCVDLIPDKSGQSIEPSVLSHVNKRARIHTNGWPGFAGLKRIGFKNHSPVKGALPNLAPELGSKKAKQDLRAFWLESIKRRKRSFGVPKDKLFSHLRESAFKWNHSEDGIYLPLLRILAANPLVQIYPKRNRIPRREQPESDSRKAEATSFTSSPVT